ncbi:conjugative transposon protein TraM [Pontibacter sp. MBLB2868]|uniref:conjugative transposon protein TraM n=1 Tax=Pontibacter sp. MBLB2868 TaxID=3451555 RepID=UPI003F74C063
METHSEAFLRRRRFLLVLPLLVLPFLTLAFWALGGGSATTAGPALAAHSQGLRLELPEPQFKDEKSPDKLSLYNQEKRNQLMQQEKSKSTSLGSLGFVNEEEPVGRLSELMPVPATSSPVADRDKTQGKPLADPSEEKINQRLEQLARLVHSEPEPPALMQKTVTAAYANPNSNGRFSQDVAKLEAMMQTMGRGDGANPEMQQLENMLERILDIQHPERVKERLQEQATEEPPRILPVLSLTEQAPVTLLEASPTGFPSILPANTLTGVPLQGQTPEHVVQNGFYSLPAPQETGTGSTIEAAIHETQTLTTGGIVKIRLLHDVMLSGRLINKGSLLYGTCRINGERLALEVTSVLIQNTVIPVALSAFDLDGLPGLYIPGTATRDAAKQGVPRAINQSLQFPALPPSIVAQAASTGIEAVKGLLTRQARQVKVMVKAGHRFLLSDNNKQF